MVATSSPLPTPSIDLLTNNDFVQTGKPISALQRMQLFSPDDWEDFVLEWADSLRSRYGDVERCGGAGDMGRDVIAAHCDDSSKWDNYQCKRYGRAALTPTDVWLEFGKLAYYTWKQEFTYPEKYSFVSPLGAGNKLSRLMKKPDELKQGLKDNWEKYCLSEITSTQEVPLSLELSKHLDTLDFSIFKAVPPMRILDDHSKTRWHAARFGGGLPARPSVPEPPSHPVAAEAVYIRCLLDAYGDHAKVQLDDIQGLQNHPLLNEHFGDSRREFYCAESLRTFSRDTLPPGEFERLQDEIQSGVNDEIRTPHDDGYRRMLAVVKLAKRLQITDHALITRTSTRDRGGICHQLANDEKVKWVP